VGLICVHLLYELIIACQFLSLRVATHAQKILLRTPQDALVAAA
jgi:hypothetical protein